MAFSKSRRLEACGRQLRQSTGVNALAIEIEGHVSSVSASGPVQGRSEGQQVFDCAAATDLGITLERHIGRPTVPIAIDNSIFIDGFQTFAVEICRRD
jgi:hypothetical protein